MEVEFPCAPDPPNGYHTVLIGCGTYGCVHLRTLNGCLVVSFLLLFGFMQPRWSAPEEGENVTARLHVTCPGPGSVSNGSGLSLRVRVRVRTEPSPNWRSGTSINPNCPFGYGSIDFSLPV